mmetsp:Transcript_20225/g.48620  ORF Transcript_20225/g.48620 Transcript_20225/m.48620 type:complete len:219 (+) Transcript_20225:1836-2492(+)
MHPGFPFQRFHPRLAFDVLFSQLHAEIFVELFALPALVIHPIFGRVEVCQLSATRCVRRGRLAEASTLGRRRPFFGLVVFGQGNYHAIAVNLAGNESIPILLAHAVLLVVLPFSIVHYPVRMGHDADAVLLVVLPIPIVHVSVLAHLALAAPRPHHELANVNISVGPPVGAVSMFLPRPRCSPRKSLRWRGATFRGRADSSPCTLPRKRLRRRTSPLP